MTSEPNSPTFKKIVEAHPNASADAVNATYKAMKLIQADEAAQLQAKKERERIDKEARIAQLRKFLEGEKSNLEAEKENVEVSKSVLASSMLALSRDFRKYKATLAKLGAEGVDVTDRALSDEETLSLLSPELGDLQSRVDEVTAAERRGREAAEKQLAEERLAREEAEKRVATVEEEIARLKAAVAGADVETVGAKEAEKRAKEAERKAKAAKASGASGASSDVESLTAALVAKEKEIVTLKGSVERKKKLYDKISLDLKKERVAHTITKTTTESKINKLTGDLKSAGIGEATEEQVKRHSAYTSLSSTLSHSKAMVNELEKSLSAGRKAYDELKKSQQAASSKKRKRSDEVMQSSSGDPVWLADIGAPVPPLLPRHPPLFLVLIYLFPPQPTSTKRGRSFANWTRRTSGFSVTSRSSSAKSRSSRLRPARGMRTTRTTRRRTRTARC